MKYPGGQLKYPDGYSVLSIGLCILGPRWCDYCINLSLEPSTSHGIYYSNLHSCSIEFIHGSGCSQKTPIFRCRGNLHENTLSALTSTALNVHYDPFFESHVEN